MPIGTAICYLSSLLFYAMGYSKTLVIKSTYRLNAYDYTLATGYLMLAIFLAVIGSLIYYGYHREQELLRSSCDSLDEKRE